VNTTRGVRLAAVIAVAALAGFLVWYFATRDTGGGSSQSPSNVVSPVAATEADIADLAKQEGRPIYWAGPQPRTTTLELTETADKNVYVRYLTGNAQVGNQDADFLTIGTYPFPDAYHALQVIANQPGGERHRIADGGLAVQNKSSPTSVYLAYPNQDIEIEVYDPDPKRALSLVTSGAVRRVR
jgi:hypothetical protein